MNRFSAYSFIIILLLALSCTKQRSHTDEISGDSSNTSASTNKPKVPEAFTLADFYGDNSALNEKTESIFNSLSDEERVGQMIIASGGNLGKSHETIRSLISNKQIGGVIMLGGDKDGMKSTLTEYNELNKSVSGLPLMFSTDAEPSLINRKISGLPDFTPTNQLTSVEESKASADAISNILKDIGFHYNYAPVCDIDINTAIIGNRSFGSDIVQVKVLSAAFIKATQSKNIVATAKHFPGHGNVKGDSHTGLVFINGELKELDIFADAIQNGVISVMIGHIAIKNNSSYNTKNIPSTLSRTIVTDLLKTEMGFKGIIITDGMNMGALKGFKNSSLKAVMAGCDLILMPVDEVGSWNSILDEMAVNEEFKQQVYESVKKLIRLKICLGLITS
jgi:beta-N-acetylhexosaminidase